MFDFIDHGDLTITHQHSALSTGAEISVAIPDEGTDVGLVLIPDIFGMRPLVDETVKQLASIGIATIAVDSFGSLEIEHSEMSREEKFTHIPQLNDTAQCANFIAAGQILRTQHGCTRVSLIGFCVGGMYTFKCAGAGVFDSVVSCYGMITMPEDWKGPGQREPMEYVEMESCSPLLAIVGGEDTYGTDDKVEILRSTLDTDHHRNIGSSIMRFPDARHAFMHDPDREEHRPEDARKAWDMALKVIQR